jgi:hypothetical protein
LRVSKPGCPASCPLWGTSLPTEIRAHTCTDTCIDGPPFYFIFWSSW